MSVMTEDESKQLADTLKKLKHTRPRITYDEYVKRANERPLAAPHFVNIRGTSGTGKSTVPILMTLNDREAVYVTDTDGAEILTYSPWYNTTMIGRYYTKTGGLDSSPFQDKDRVDDVLNRVWRDTHTHILMEGLVCSGMFNHYAELFKKLEESPNQRYIMIMNLIGDMDTLEQRILNRSGRKKVRMQHVQAKQTAVMKNFPKFQEAGFKTWLTSTQGIAFDSVLDWYHKEIDDVINEINVDGRTIEELSIRITKNT